MNQDLYYQNLKETWEKFERAVNYLNQTYEKCNMKLWIICCFLKK